MIAAGTCLLLVERERERLCDGWVTQLQAVVSRSAEVARLWFFERRMDAEVLAEYPLTKRVLSGAHDPKTQDARDLAVVLERIRTSYGYTEVFVLDAAGEVVASAPSILANDSVRQLAILTARSKQAQVSIVDAGLHLAFAAPVDVAASGTTAAAAAGAVVLEMEPRTALHPRLAGPTGAASGETLLIGAGDDGVVVLSPRRFEPDPLAALPLEHGKTPGPSSALLAALSRGEVVPPGEHVDYRGEPVLVAIQGTDVPGFAVAAKIDRAEALAPLAGYTATTSSVAGLALLSLFGLGAAVRLRARARAMRAELDQQQRALQLRQVEERSARLGRALDESSDELYILDARTLRVLETNARARRHRL